MCWIKKMSLARACAGWWLPTSSRRRKKASIPNKKKKCELSSQKRQSKSTPKRTRWTSSLNNK